MPAYKYQTRTGKQNGMQIFTIQTGSAKKSINANVDLIQKDLQKSMNGCS